MSTKYKSLIRTVELQDAVGGRGSPHFDRESKHFTGPLTVKPKPRSRVIASLETSVFYIPNHDEKFL